MTSQQKRIEKFLQGHARAARFRDGGHVTEQESADLSHEFAGSQALLCFLYLLGQPMTHFDLERLIPSRDGRGGRRTDTGKKLGLIEASMFDAWVDETERWGIVWKVTPLGESVARERDIKGIRVHVDRRVRVRPMKEAS